MHMTKTLDNICSWGQVPPLADACRRPCSTNSVAVSICVGVRGGW